MNTLPKLCLNMIVKNESHIIKNKLDRLLKKVDIDYYVICDTGSDDNTKEIIKSFFDNKNIEGEIFDHKWKDFGTNRTLALTAAFGKSQYILIFDADDEIEGTIHIPDDLGKYDKYNLKIGDSFAYYRPLLLNNQKKWQFVGVLHEYLITNEKDIKETLLPGSYFIKSCREGNRNMDKDKYLKDAEILETAYEKVKNTNEHLANRYIFYCGQSYKDSGSKYFPQAIKWYSKLLNTTAWEQEKYYSCIMLGDLYEDKFEKIRYYMKSIEYDKERIEGIVFACKLASDNGLYGMVDMIYERYKNIQRPIQNKLFLFSNLYNDHLLFYASVSNYYLNNISVGYALSKSIINNNIIDGYMLEQTYKNLLFYKTSLENDNTTNLFHLLNKYIHMKHKTSQVICNDILTLWNFLFDLNKSIFTKPTNYSFHNSSTPTIVLTFTTCKRLDLFKQTVYSLLNHITDLEDIHYWLCVDDNSSDEDRKEMKSLFPWIDYYMKTPAEKGHRKSMNIIYDKLIRLNPKYWFHLEDDFLFFNNVSIVDTTKKLELLKSDNVKQILFNINYAEVIHDYSIKGELNTNIDNVVIHNCKSGKYNYRNCHYWPYYSFRPSITLFDAIKSIGNFDTNNQFFEMDYANKFMQKGYKSAFLNEINHIHIGKLTSQVNSEIKNAYALNNENQFTNDLMHIKIVNLERRPDRKDKVNKLFNNENIHSWNFYKAVDGNEIELDINNAKLFHGNDFGSRKGVIGCALSHYYIWKELLQDTDNNFYVIFEDDIELCSDFQKRLNSLNQEMNDREYLLLGYSMFDKLRKQNSSLYNNKNDVIKVKSLDKKLYIGGTFGYSINKTGAKKMIDYIEKHGIKHGIDYLILINNDLLSYECNPQLVFSEWNENGKNIDSDIQNTSDRFDIDKIIASNNDDFTFFKHMDQINFDTRKNNNNIEENLKSCFEDLEVAGFNTLGFVKSNIMYLQKSPYFTDSDGIYIKNNYLNYLGYDISKPPANLPSVINTYDKGLFCFIHSTVIEQYELDSLDQIIDFLMLHNKINIFSKIFIINNGVSINKNRYIHYPNIIVVELSSDIYKHEISTINLMYHFSLLNSNSKILYMHTKDVDQENNDNLKDWIDMMLYFLISKNESCIKYLENNDVVGCNYQATQKPHFSGNFWWANANYLKKLSIIKSNNKDDAKFWLFSTSRCKYKCIYNSQINHYVHRYPKESYEKIRIKLICNWCSSKELCNEWKHLCIDGFTWNNIEITWENENTDFFVIINYPIANEYYDKKKTIIFQMEPWVHNKDKNWGVKTWGEWAIPNETDFLKVIGRQSNTYNNIAWQIHFNDEQLKQITYDKSDILSCITTDKYFDEGHIARIDFLKFLEAKGDISMNIFGKCEKIKFENYISPLPMKDKHTGMLPFKYYFMIENNYEENYITEKFWEPILCECLIFYYGCPNVKHYVDNDVFVPLNMNNFEESYQIIKKAIHEDWWSQRIFKIKKFKEKILNDMAFFPRLRNFIVNDI